MRGVFYMLAAVIIDRDSELSGNYFGDFQCLVEASLAIAFWM